MDHSELFQFGVQPPPESVATAVVPGTVTTKKELLCVLQTGLSLPGYFGHNWDALAECIGDFAWLPPGSVAIFHEHLPALETRVLMTYLSVLKRGVEKWQTNPDRKLLVIFPLSSKTRVMDLLRVRILR